MKLVKIVSITLFSILSLFLLIAAFVNGNYEVSRSIIIYTPTPEVFTYVSHIRNQDAYSAWAKKDPNSEKSYTGSDASVGFVARWNSKVKEVGQGEQEIIKITPGKRIDMELRFKKPYKSVNYAYMETTALDEAETKVTWSFSGNVPYPMNISLLFLNMEPLVGKQLNEGLVNLKAILEKK